MVSSLIMMVKDKTGDIAVLRTIGASRGAVMRIFLMCGASVGVLGTIIGTVIGVLFCANIERIRHVVEAITGTNVFNPEVYYLDPPARPARPARGDPDRGDGAGAVAAGHAVSQLAGRPHRSGRGAAP